MNPPRSPAGWEVSPPFNDLKQQANSVIDAQFSASGFWAWKDPRACLTLSFWQQILPGMAYVLCVRHPDDVVASLKRRNRIAEMRSIYLWLLYNGAAFADAHGKRLHVMTYENLMCSQCSKQSVSRRSCRLQLCRVRQISSRGSLILSEGITTPRGYLRVMCRRRLCKFGASRSGGLPHHGRTG